MKELLYKLSYSDLKILQRILERKRRTGEYPDVKELGLKKSDVYHLIRLGIVEVKYFTKQYFVVKVREDIEPYIEEVLEEKTRELSDELIDNTLNIEYLYVKPDLKDILKKAIMRKIWILLVGRSGVGKTEILKVLNRLPRTVYFNGTLLRKDDILNIYNEPYVEVILINELDKCHSHAVYDVLIEMHDENRWCVIATANDTRKFPEPLKSRFIRYYLEYSINEIVDIIELVLKNKYRITNIDRNKISRLYKELGDIRQVIERYRLEI